MPGCGRGEVLTWRSQSRKILYLVNNHLEQAELGVPHTKSKLSGPNQNVSYVRLGKFGKLVEDKISKCRELSLPNLGGMWVDG